MKRYVSTSNIRVLKTLIPEADSESEDNKKETEEEEKKRRKREQEEEEKAKKDIRVFKGTLRDKKISDRKNLYKHTGKALESVQKKKKIAFKKKKKEKANEMRN